MEPTIHPFSSLFQQLGLPDDDASIRAFIESHRPLPDTVLMADADFWSPAQARFLRESIAADADWATVVDQLSVALRDA